MAAHLDNFIDPYRVAFFNLTRLATLFAHFITDIEPGHIGHGESTHGETKVEQDFINLFGAGALFNQICRLARALVQHAVADKTITNTDHSADFANALGKAHHGGNHIIGSKFTAHVLEQAHHIGRAEKVHADHILWSASNTGNFIHIEG